MRKKQHTPTNTRTMKKPTTGSAIIRVKLLEPPDDVADCDGCTPPVDAGSCVMLKMRDGAIAKEFPRVVRK